MPVKLPPDILRCLDHRAETLFAYSVEERHRKIADRYDVLPYMVARYEEIFDTVEEAIEFLAMKPKDILRAIRVNTLRTSKDVVREVLENKGFVLEDYWIPYTLIVIEEPLSVGATHEYMQGLYYNQGAGSQVPVYITDPKPLQHVIDLAAAPGGKATQIAQHQRDTTPIIALDISPRRLASLKNNANRLGVKSIVALLMDAREAPRKLKQKFDYILLDAPCTGEGLLPLDPRRRKTRTPIDLADRACLQKQMLEAALKLAKEGALIVYTTCSIAPEENEYVISIILDKYGDKVDLVDPPIKPPIYNRGIEEYNGVSFNSKVRRCIRLHPTRTRTEGFVICVLRTRKT